METLRSLTAVQLYGCILLVLSFLLWCLLKSNQLGRTSSGGVQEFRGFISFLLILVGETVLRVIMWLAGLGGAFLLFIEYSNKHLF